MHLLGLWPPPKTCSSSSSSPPKSLTRTRTPIKNKPGSPSRGVFRTETAADIRTNGCIGRSVGDGATFGEGGGDRISSSRLVRKSIFAYQVMEEKRGEGVVRPHESPTDHPLRGQGGEEWGLPGERSQEGWLLAHLARPEKLGESPRRSLFGGRAKVGQRRLRTTWEKEERGEERERHDGIMRGAHALLSPSSFVAIWV